MNGRHQPLRELIAGKTTAQALYILIKYLEITQDWTIYQAVWATAWLIAGNPLDIKSLALEDIKDFFQTYPPKNTTSEDIQAALEQLKTNN